MRPEGATRAPGGPSHQLAGMASAPAPLDQLRFGLAAATGTRGVHGDSRLQVDEFARVSSRQPARPEVTMSKTDELRRAQREALAKAPHPTAPLAVTPVEIATDVAAIPVSTDVPDQTSACTVAPRQALGLVVRWDAGVGQPGLDVAD